MAPPNGVDDYRSFFNLKSSRYLLRFPSKGGNVDLPYRPRRGSQAGVAVPSFPRGTRGGSRGEDVPICSSFPCSGRVFSGAPLLGGCGIESVAPEAARRLAGSLFRIIRPTGVDSGPFADVESPVTVSFSFRCFLSEFESDLFMRILPDESLIASLSLLTLGPRLFPLFCFLESMSGTL